MAFSKEPLTMQYQTRNYNIPNKERGKEFEQVHELEFVDMALKRVMIFAHFVMRCTWGSDTDYIRTKTGHNLLYTIIISRYLVLI